MMKIDIAYFPSPPRGVWFWGEIPIRAYAVCILIGIIIAITWTNKRWIARGGAQGQVESIAILAVPFGIIGGRLYHVMTDWRLYFGSGGLHPIDALKIWDGGLGIWGAVFLGGVGAWIACRRLNIPLRDFADAVAPPILLAQAIGRIGNYFNQELFGRVTTLPWGLKIYYRIDHGAIGYGLVNGHSTGEVYRIVQPTFLYELLWNIFFVVVLLYAEKTFKLRSGQVFALYVCGYCFGRFFVELLRDDSAMHIFGLRVNTLTSSICYFASLAWLVRSRFKQVQGVSESHISLNPASSHIQVTKMGAHSANILRRKSTHESTVSLENTVENSSNSGKVPSLAAGNLIVKSQEKFSAHKIFSPFHSHKKSARLSSAETQNLLAETENLLIKSEDAVSKIWAALPSEPAEYFHDAADPRNLKRAFIPHNTITQDSLNTMTVELSETSPLTELENYISPDFSTAHEPVDPFAPPLDTDDLTEENTFVVDEVSTSLEKPNSKMKTSSPISHSVFSFKENERYVSLDSKEDRSGEEKNV